MPVCLMSFKKEKKKLTFSSRIFVHKFKQKEKTWKVLSDKVNQLISFSTYPTPTACLEPALKIHMSNQDLDYAKVWGIKALKQGVSLNIA